MSSQSITAPSQSRISDVRAMPEFAELRRRSRNFTFTAGLLLFSWCISLFWAVGYAPELMSVQVIGLLNIGFLFVWSQVGVTVCAAALYVRHLKNNAELIAKMRDAGSEKK